MSVFFSSMRHIPLLALLTENEAILDAIAAFKARAGAIAEALEKPYRIKQLTVNSSSRVVQPVSRTMAKAMSAEVAPMPMKSGESLVSVTISGQTEVE